MSDPSRSRERRVTRRSRRCRAATRHDQAMNTHEPITLDELQRVAPDVAAPIVARLAATGLGILGTARADGSPRVSPIEVSIQEGRLYAGSMPGSRKAEDLRRDPRLLHPHAGRRQGRPPGRGQAVLRRSADRGSCRGRARARRRTAAGHRPRRVRRVAGVRAADRRRSVAARRRRRLAHVELGPALRRAPPRTSRPRWGDRRRHGLISASGGGPPVPWSRRAGRPRCGSSRRSARGHVPSPPGRPR